MSMSERIDRSAFLWPALSTSLYVCFALLVAAVVKRWLHYHRRAPKVPAIGFLPIPYVGSWIAAVKFMLYPVACVRSGIAETNNGMFRIATLSDEFIVVANKEQVAEYLKSPDSVLSMQDGANDQQQIPFTMGFGVAYRTYHNVVVHKQITPRIPSFTPVMVSEIEHSFKEQIGLPEEFTPISLYGVIAMTVARVSNSIFVDGDYRRNKEYLQNATDYAQAVVLSAEVVRLFPHWAKSIVIKILPVTTCMRKAVGFLGKDVQDRLEERYDGGKKPDDLIQWLIDAAPPVEKTVYQIVERVMALNVASIHTTTMTFTPAIYSLAAEPSKYIDTLRNEVVQNLEDGQITHTTTQNLIYMESFLRESARFDSNGLAAMQRNALKPFVFSDGTVIPAGAKLVAPSLTLQRDRTVLEDPDVFDGFRWVHEIDGSKMLQKTMVTTGTDYHLFGHGRHPCPGRFFASHEMKLMFAILLLRYDISLVPGTKPKEIYVATMSLPDTTMEVLFKARPQKD